MARSELHAEFAAWLKERAGQVFEPGCLEWDLIQLVFENYRHEGWAAKCLKVRVVRNNRGHAGTEFLTPLDAEYRPGEWCAASWASCFSQTMTPRRRLMTAMRLAVEPQIERFRVKTPKPALCPVLQTVLGPEPHVDHVPPKTFAFLVDEFVRGRGEPEVVTKSAAVGPEIACVDALRSWQEFHEQYAELRWLSKKANLTVKS